MPTKKKDATATTDQKSNAFRRKELRRKIRSITVVKQEDTSSKQDDPVIKQPENMASRQVEIEGDSFLLAGIYKAQTTLLIPPYAFENLYKNYEESDALQTSINAMVNNIDGFGHAFQFLGKDLELKASAEAKTQLTKVENFFSQVNDEHSFRKLRKEFRKELEIIGISGFEIIRDSSGGEIKDKAKKTIGWKQGAIQMIFHAKFKNIRMARRPAEGVKVTVNIMRDGKLMPITMVKYFRRFAQLEEGTTLKWFKEYGDPRHLCAIDGAYKKSPKECKQVASEILAIKNEVGNEPYGLPRWIGGVLQVLGRTSAQYVNFDLFESQGIPPMAIMVSGGVLNDDSLEELEGIIRSLRGIGKWNKILILESEPNSMSLEDKGGAKIELKNLSEYRAEDQMFDRYLSTTEGDIRHIYRLPDLYTGASETYTHSTSKSAQKVAEEQVFVPEREDFDEIVNFQFMQKEFGITLWKFVTKGPKLSGAEDIAKGVETFGKGGAFTINNAIDQANSAFNTQMSKFTEKWADYPFPIVMKLISLGRLKLDDIENASLPTQITETYSEVKKNLEKMATIVGIAENIPDDDELQKVEGIDPKVIAFLTTLRELTKYLEPPEKETPVKKGKKIKIKEK